MLAGINPPKETSAQDRIRDAELPALEGDLVGKLVVAAVLADFDALWECLAPREQARLWRQVLCPAKL